MQDLIKHYIKQSEYQERKGYKNKPCYGELLNNKNYTIYLSEDPPTPSINSEIFPVTLKPSGDLSELSYYLQTDLDSKTRTRAIVSHLNKSNLITVHKLIVVMAGHNPSGLEIHHCNINSMDNRYANVLIVTKKLHSDFHRKYPRIDQVSSAVLSKDHLDKAVGFLKITFEPPLLALPGGIHNRQLLNTEDFKRLGYRPQRAAIMAAILAAMADLGGKEVRRKSILENQQVSGINQRRLERSLYDLIKALYIISDSRGVYSISAKSCK